MNVSDLHYLFALRYIPFDNEPVKQEDYLPDTLPSKINIALSSGIDSHYLLHLLCRGSSFSTESANYSAICLDFTDTRDSEEKESVKAKEIAERYGVKFTSFNVDDPLAQLPKLISIVKEPRFNLYQYYLYIMAQETGALVTGDGADEVYLGYTFRYKKYLDSIDSCYKDWKAKVQLYLNGHANDWVIDQEDLFVDKYKFKWDLITNHFKEFFYADLPVQAHLTDCLYPVVLADIHGKLRWDYIPNNNKLANNLGVKLITPFLYQKDFEQALRDYHTSQKYDYHTNTGKIPLRQVIGRMDDSTKRGFGFDLLKYWTRKGFDIVHNKINKDSLVFEYINRYWWIRHHSDTAVNIINKYLQIYALELYLEQFPIEEDEQCIANSV